MIQCEYETIQAIYTSTSTLSLYCWSIISAKDFITRASSGKEKKPHVLNTPEGLRSPNLLASHGEKRRSRSYHSGPEIAHEGLRFYS